MTLANAVEASGGTIQTGPFGSQLHQSDYTDIGVPVVMPQDIVNNQISYDKIVFISEDMARKLSRHTLVAGDIVFPRRGDVTKCAYIDTTHDGALCGTGCLKVHFGDDSTNIRYLFYYLQQRWVGEWLENHAVGATMLNLNTDILGRLPFDPPERIIQDDIAETLTSFDDAMENNTRRIALLEEAARLIFKEWFVHLRFPGHEKVQVVDGVPEGWQPGVLGDVLTLKRGHDLPKKARKAGDIPIVSSSGFTGSHNEAKATGPGIVTGRYGTLGQVFLVHEDYWPLNTALYVVDTKGHPVPWLYSLLKEVMVGRGQGEKAAVPGVNRNDLHRIPVAAPPDSLIRDYTDIAGPMFNQIHTLSQQNTKLAEARDLLLPRLMDGRITP